MSFGLPFGPGFKISPLRVEERRDVPRSLRPSSPPRTHVDIPKHLQAKHSESPRAPVLGTSPPLHPVGDEPMHQPGALAQDYYSETASFLASLRGVLQSEAEGELAAAAAAQFQEDSRRWMSNYNRLTTQADKAFASLYEVVLLLTSHLEQSPCVVLTAEEREEMLVKLAAAEHALGRELALEATRAAEY